LLRLFGDLFSREQNQVDVFLVFVGKKWLFQTFALEIFAASIF